MHTHAYRYHIHQIKSRSLHNAVFFFCFEGKAPYRLSAAAAPTAYMRRAKWHSAGSLAAGGVFADVEFCWNPVQKTQVSRIGGDGQQLYSGHVGQDASCQSQWLLANGV